MRILGLDASSRTVGYTILDLDKNGDLRLIDCNYLKPPKKGDIFERLKKTQDMITKVLTEHKPDVVAIEDIAKFMAGASTAKTIITLAVFNRSVGLACYNFLGQPPELYNVMKVRHGIKLNKQFPKKEEIPELVSKHLGIKFPYVYKQNKKKKILEIADESFDIADSMAIAYYHALCVLKKK